MNQHAVHMCSLEPQNQKLGQLLEPKFLVDTITQIVASNLNIGKNIKPDSSSSGYTGKPYLGKPHPPQLAPGVDGLLDPALTCWYCKNTGCLKENCAKLTQWLALDKKEPSNKVASNNVTSVASQLLNQEK